MIFSKKIFYFAYILVVLFGSIWGGGGEISIFVQFAPLVDMELYSCFSIVHFVCQSLIGSYWVPFL